MIKYKSMKNVKVALATIKKPHESYIENQKIFCRWTDKASKNNADIICFPEMSLYMHFPNRKPPTDEHELLEPIKEAAKRGNIHVIAPTNIMLNNKLYNRAYLIDRSGKLMGFYDKCFGFYDRTIGGKYPVFETDFGTIGIAICYDLGFEEPVRKLANNGAKLVFTPIYYGANDKDDQAQFVKCVPFTRSYENKVIVAAVNVAEGLPYASVCSPRRKIVEYIGKPEEEKLVFAEFRFDELEKTKAFYWTKTLVKKSDIRRYKWLADKPENVKLDFS